jgi:hypothetical protein
VVVDGLVARHLLELILGSHGAGSDDGGANGGLGRDAAVGGAKGRGTEGDGGGEEGSGHRVAALCVVTGDEPIVIGLSIAVQLAVSSRALILLRLVTQAKRSRKGDYFEIHSLYTNSYVHQSERKWRVIG